MTVQSAPAARGEDTAGIVLKWTLLAVGIITFALLGWATSRTYQLSPPTPARFLAPDGSVVLTSADIVAGKAGFQRADLMDYGSLYGMGSYFGEDYTAEYLVKLATLTEGELARSRYGKSLSALSPDERFGVRTAMRAELQGIDLTRSTVTLADPLARAIVTLRGQITASLLHPNYARGWTQARSLDPASAARTADFLIYSSITTVARRPGGLSRGTGEKAR